MSDRTYEAASGAPAKAELMQAIQDALGKTAIATANVWNPWSAACEEGVDKVAIKGQGKGLLTAAPQTIPEDLAFGDLGVKRAAYAGWYREAAKDKDLELTEKTLPQAKLLLKKAYLQWGRANWKKMTGGNCTYFAGTIIGFLSDQASLVPAGASVELFNLAEGGEGHAFVVVGRDLRSAPGKMTTWGKDCFVIDQWFARQRLTAPGKYAVKELTDTASIFYDKAFVTFISKGVITRGTAYTRDELTTLY